MGTSLAVQWLKLHASRAGNMGTKTPYALQCDQKTKTKLLWFSLSLILKKKKKMKEIIVSVKKL